MDESNLQMLLAHDSGFLDRVQYLMTQNALTVLAEVNTTPAHALRTQLARQVLTNPGQAAINAAPAVVGSANLVAATTTITPADVVAGTPQTVSTSATDAAILSQIFTLWNALAGVST